MNKKELIVDVASKLEMPKAQAEKTVNTVLESIKEGVKKDGSVGIVNFGTFVAKTRQPRTARNPRTGETVQIPARRTVTFRAGKEFKASV